jgi:2-polyprenyl-3-methyl-5-hydroxy-6-metoxy-1,4-benzoquinol methylase
VANQDILANFKRYKFYHRIELPEGIVTPGHRAAEPQQDLVRRNLDSVEIEGKRVLDVGCRDGLFCFEAERRGASEVIGIDNELSHGATEFLIPHLKSGVKMYELNVIDLTPETFGKFDLIICPGVLYHLRYPFAALRALHNALNNNGILLLETAVLRAWERHSLLYCPTGAESPYDETSVTFFNIHGLRSSLQSFGFEIVSTDFLLGRKVRSTRGTTIRHLILTCAVAVQKVFPQLVHALLGRFVIDRAVFVCRRVELSNKAHLEAYWNATHAKYAGVRQDA